MESLCKRDKTTSLGGVQEGWRFFDSFEFAIGSRKVKNTINLRLIEYRKKLAPIEIDLNDWNNHVMLEEEIGDEVGFRLGNNQPLFLLLNKELMDLSRYYAESTASEVCSIREMLSEFENILSYMACFVGALVPQVKKGGEDLFICGLAVASMQDGRCDPRDLFLSLGSLINAARNSDIDVNLGLKKIAALSTTNDRFGMGSIKEFLLHQMKGCE